MKKCSGCMSNSRCGNDFSSRAPQKPSLVDLTVVRRFFAVSFVRISTCLNDVAEGTMSQEDFQKKCEAISTRLTEIFSGYFSDYEDGPEFWNPKGLAEVLRDVLAKNGVWDEEGVPNSDEAVVNKACKLFVEQSVLAAHELLANGVVVRNEKEIPQNVDSFIEGWAMVFAGAVF